MALVRMSLTQLIETLPDMEEILDEIDGRYTIELSEAANKEWVETIPEIEPDPDET
jgi:hypothetical protein